MNITNNTTIKELAVATPGATRVFESFRIDYCCGGERSLFEACEAARLPFDEVVQALKAEELRAKDPQDASRWQNESLSAIAAHILDHHHAFTKSELERIDVLMEKVCARHQTNHPELGQVDGIYHRLKNELIPHMLKEEQVLFPYLAQMEEAIARQARLPQPFFGTVRNPVRMMGIEHDTAGELLRTLRQATSEYLAPEDACASYKALYQALEGLETDLHLHIHLENNILFPAAVAMESGAAPERLGAVKDDCERSFCGH